MTSPLWLLRDPSGRVWELPHRDHDRPHALRECVEKLMSLGQTIPPRVLSKEERTFARAWEKEFKWATRVAKKRHQQRQPHRLHLHRGRLHPRTQGDGWMNDATHLHVEAEVRYWEDATVNDVRDVEGTLVPFRNGEKWCPVIRLADGVVENWPAGTTADVYYKVCDQGEYWLANAEGKRLFKWRGDYVPDAWLAHGDERGYGDYIILDIDANGRIQHLNTPVFVADEWEAL